jgi:hypothetical protein
MNPKQIEIHCSGPVYMPDGTPAPYVMTAEEAVKFLRLDTNGSKHPDTTLQYYIDEQMLVPVSIHYFNVGQSIVECKGNFLILGTGRGIGSLFSI